MSGDGRLLPLMPEYERVKVSADNLRLDQRTLTLDPYIVEHGAVLWAQKVDGRARRTTTNADAFLGEMGVSFTENRSMYMAYERAIRAAGLDLQRAAGVEGQR